MESVTNPPRICLKLESRKISDIASQSVTKIMYRSNRTKKTYHLICGFSSTQQQNTIHIYSLRINDTPINQQAHALAEKTVLTRQKVLIYINQPHARFHSPSGMSFTSINQDRCSVTGMVLFIRPLGDFNKSLNYISNFQADISNWWLRYLLWNCPPTNAIGPHWW